MWREKERESMNGPLVSLYCSVGLSRSMDLCTEHIGILDSPLYTSSGLRRISQSKQEMEEKKSEKVNRVESQERNELNKYPMVGPGKSEFQAKGKVRRRVSTGVQESGLKNQSERILSP